MTVPTRSARRTEFTTELLSAGTTAAEHVHPEAVDVMRELGMDLAGRIPRALTPAPAEQADLVVTMGCGDECPYIPDKRYIDWDPQDPAGRPLDELRTTRDDIARHRGPDLRPRPT